MQQEHDRAVVWAGFGDVEVDAVGCDPGEAHDVCEVGHEMFQR
jgi:hypothetical protein